MQFLNYLFITISLLGCKSAIKNKLSDPHIVCYEITQTFPLIKNTGKLIGYDTATVNVCYFKDLVLYELYYLYDSSDNQQIREKRYHYFVYQHNDQEGIDFDNYKIPIEKKVKVDSLFKNEWVKRNNLYNSFVNYKAILLDSNNLNASITSFTNSE